MHSLKLRFDESRRYSNATVSKWETRGTVLTKIKAFLNIELSLRPSEDYRLADLNFRNKTFMLELLSDKAKEQETFIALKWDLYRTATIVSNL